MRSFRTIAVAIVGLGVLTAPALAGQKCHGQISHIRTCDGCTAIAHWTVTRIQKGPDDNHFCSTSWRSLGGHQQFALIQPPSLGTARFKDYRIEYRGEKLGHDTMVVKQSWLSRTNAVMTATVTYDINVVDAL